MWKWLRSWFAWRFSLRRLVIATVFLGAVVGLNMRMIGPMTMNKQVASYQWKGGLLYLTPTQHDSSGQWIVGKPSSYWGWPLPSIVNPAVADHPGTFNTTQGVDGAVKEMEVYFNAQGLIDVAADAYQLPVTHETYQLLKSSNLAWLNTGNGRILCNLIDALVALIPLFLILFLQIHRRQVSAGVSDQ